MGGTYCPDGRWKKSTQSYSLSLEGKHSHGRSKIRWEDNIILALKQIDYEDDCKTLAQDKVTWHAYVMAAMNLPVP